jgi:hypothetical protein
MANSQGSRRKGNQNLFRRSFKREKFKCLPPEGFYHFSDGSGVHAGMYARGSKGLNKFGFDKFAFEDVQANRTRFGWPFRTITLDVVPRESEWHLVFETFWFANKLFFSFLGWLCIQPVFDARKWLFRFNKSAGKSGQPAGIVSDTDSQNLDRCKSRFAALWGRPRWMSVAASPTESRQTFTRSDDGQTGSNSHHYFRLADQSSSRADFSGAI